MGSHRFNSSTREVETGVIWLGGERNLRLKETETQGSLRFGRDRFSLGMMPENRLVPWV